MLKRKVKKLVVLFFILMIGLSGLSPVLAQPPHEEKNILNLYVSDVRGYSVHELHPTYTTCLAFTVGAAIYPDVAFADKTVTLEFAGFLPASNPTFGTSAAKKDAIWDATTGKITWQGVLNAADATDFWVAQGDNVYYQQTRAFPVVMSVDGQPFANDTATLVNTCDAPPPPVVTLKKSTWFIAGNVSTTTSLELTSLKVPVVTGVAFYHSDTGLDIPFTVTFNGYYSKMQPRFVVNGVDVTSTCYDPATGICTVEGVMNANGATEVFVEMLKNTPGKHNFVVTLESALFADHDVTTFVLTNPTNVVYLPSFNR